MANSGSKWIDDHQDQLPLNNWVACIAEGLVACDPDIEKLMEKLSELKVDSQSVCIHYHTDDVIQ